ncbi:hypothetical protein [uncultured Chitinophaga sp.]|uniref:hypothetical protein n=1 Tax=uncultured Chitinophaga sp. TaxID=339340 RepID=UPI0025D115E9|nr:hypothetical protein [uncultured Chitinophaga sp.]
MIRLLLIALFLTPVVAKSQEKVFVPAAGGNASAATIFKRICFREVGTNAPLTGVHFTAVRNQTPFTSGKSDSCGCSVVRFTMSNYYAKVLINLNDNTYMKPDWPERRNTKKYEPINTKIAFKNRQATDTTFIFLKTIQ